MGAAAQLFRQGGREVPCQIKEYCIQYQEQIAICMLKSMDYLKVLRWREMSFPEFKFQKIREGAPNYLNCYHFYRAKLLYVPLKVSLQPFSRSGVPDNPQWIVIVPAKNITLMI